MSTNAKKNRRQIAPRIQVVPLQHVAYRPDKPLLSKPIPVANISPFGLGFLSSSFADGKKPSSGEKLSGKLMIGDTQKPVAVEGVTIEVRHASDRLIGGMFLSPSPGLKNAIDAYFKLELSALAMHKVDSKHHKREEDGDAVWIYGDNCEAYFVVKNDRILRFRLVFLGNQVESRAEGKISIGHIVEEAASGRPGMKGSVIVEEVSKLSTDLVQATLTAAGRFLHNVTELQPEYRRQIEALLKP